MRKRGRWGGRRALLGGSCRKRHGQCKTRSGEARCGEGGRTRGQRWLAFSHFLFLRRAARIRVQSLSACLRLRAWQRQSRRLQRKTEGKRVKRCHRVRARLTSLFGACSLPLAGLCLSFSPLPMASPQPRPHPHGDALEEVQRGGLDQRGCRGFRLTCAFRPSFPMP